MKSQFTTFLCLVVCTLLSLAACGDSSGACTVDDNGDGTATLTCDDGSEFTVQGTQEIDPQSCSVSENDDGTFRIECDDGSSVTFRDGEDGARGEDGSGCTVTDNTDGTYTVSCDDGTEATLSDGEDGATGEDGSGCTVTDNTDGTYTVSCDDGTQATFRDGEDGAKGEDGGNCTVVDNTDGTYTISCPDGSSETVAEGISALSDPVQVGPAGGNGGVSYSLACPDGHVAVGAVGSVTTTFSAGAVLGGVGLKCQEVVFSSFFGAELVGNITNSSPVGDTSGFDLSCGNNQVMVGISGSLLTLFGTFGVSVEGLKIHCRGIGSSSQESTNVNPNSTSTYDLPCPDNKIVTGLFGRADQALDAIGVVCR